MEWKRVFDQFSITSDTTLVGHSCGAGFLLRWLGENRIEVDKLILVAPWLDPIKNRKGFLDFQIDKTIQERIKELHIFYSDNESVEGVKESVDVISKILSSAKIRTFKGMGHLTFEEMKTEKFPELLETILK